MNEMITWLRAQLDTDEAYATAAAAKSSAEWREESSWLKDLRDPLPSQRRSHGLTAGANLISDADAAHIANYDPARVLRQVQAHRAILDEWAKVTQPGMKRPRYSGDAEEWFSGHDAGYLKALEFAIKALVSIYSDRDRYKEEWSA